MVFPATKPGLIIQPVDGEETLVCDKSSGQVHLLSTVPYLVFRACREQLSRERAESLFFDEDVEFVEEEVAEALELLHESGMIEALPEAGCAELEAIPGKTSRRRFLQAASAAVAVASVAMPRPAQAATGPFTVIQAIWGADSTTRGNCGDLGAVFPGTGCSGTPCTEICDSIITGCWRDVTGDAVWTAAVTAGGGNGINIAATNANFGDVINGYVKELRVTFACGPNEYTVRTCENNTFNVTC